MKPVPEREALTGANLMSVRKGALRLKGPVKNITPNIEHGRLLVLAGEIVIERIMCAVWSIIECISH
jgi:hypothetical protein